MALLFLNGVFTGTAGGGMSICIFHVETDEILPHTLIACRVLNDLPPYCVSCVTKRIFFNKKNPCIVNMLYNIGFVSFIVRL